MADILDSITSLLESNWTSSNTSGVTPVIGNIFDYKRIDLSRTPRNGGDYVLVYSSGYRQKPSGINKISKNTTSMITVDVRSGVNRAHAILIRDEVLNVLDAAMADPFTSYVELETDEIRDLSDKSKLLWRFVMTVRVLALNVSR